MFLQRVLVINLINFNTWLCGVTSSNLVTVLEEFQSVLIFTTRRPIILDRSPDGKGQGDVKGKVKGR